MPGRLALLDQMERAGSESEIGLTFYRSAYVLVERDGGRRLGSYRANSVRDADGRVVWLSYGRRLYGREE